MKKFLKNLGNTEPSVYVFSAIFALIAEIIIGLTLYSEKATFAWGYTSTVVAVYSIIAPILVAIVLIIAFEDLDDFFMGAVAVGGCALLLGIIIWVSTLIVGGPITHAAAYYKQAESIISQQSIDDPAKAVVFSGEVDNDNLTVPQYGEEEAVKKAQAELAKTSAAATEIKLIEPICSQELNGRLVYTLETSPRNVFKRNATLQYFVVDRVTGEAQSYSCESWKYARGKYFSFNAERYLKKEYPREMITDLSLEITPDGEPMYVASVLKKDFVYGYDVVKGVIILNPVDGTHNYYEIHKIPSWVDRAYPEDTLESYVRYYGSYANGFWNSLFAQKGVLMPTQVKDTDTDDNHRVATQSVEVVNINGESYLWTGMNPANADDAADSNGIMLASLKTGEITFYQTSGVSELHAVQTAEGVVQEKGYYAGYPIPVRVGDVPALFLIMRDNGGNIHGYSLVKYADYTKNAYAEDIRDLVPKFLAVCGKTQTTVNNKDKTKSKTFNVWEIKTEIIDGRTTYYLYDNKDVKYVMTSEISLDVLDVEVGSKVQIKYVPATEKNTANSISEFAIL